MNTQMQLHSVLPSKSFERERPKAFTIREIKHSLGNFPSAQSPKEKLIFFYNYLYLLSILIVKLFQLIIYVRNLF